MMERREGGKEVIIERITEVEKKNFLKKGFENLINSNFLALNKNQKMIFSLLNFLYSTLQNDFKNYTKLFVPGEVVLMRKKDENQLQEGQLEDGQQQQEELQLNINGMAGDGDGLEDDGKEGNEEMIKEKMELRMLGHCNHLIEQMEFSPSVLYAHSMRKYVNLLHTIEVSLPSTLPDQDPLPDTPPTPQ